MVKVMKVVRKFWTASRDTSSSSSEKYFTIKNKIIKISISDL